MSDATSGGSLQKRYHLDKNFLDAPLRFGDILLVQIGRLHCSPHTVIDMHTHRNWFELTVVTDGLGSVTVGDRTTAVRAGDIHLSFPGDFHEIRTDRHAPLKYDFLSFYPTSHELLEPLECIMQKGLREGDRIIRNEKINQLLENTIAEITIPSRYSNEIMAAGLRQILFYLVRSFETDTAPAKKSVSVQEELCYQIMHYIDTHVYTMDSLTELADSLRYNYSYLSDLFKRVTGDTLQGYYRERRLRAAKLLLSEEKLLLGEIASLLRYSSIYTFSRAFKDRFGISPSAYRQRAPKE